MTRRGLALTESLVALVLAVLVFGLALGAWTWSRRHGQGTLGAHLELQIDSRRALLEIITELQESVEFVRPAAGSTLSYLVCRDKLNRVLTIYAARNELDSERAGKPMHDLFMHRRDPASPPGAPRRLVTGVERVAFTAMSSATLQIHIDFHEQGRVYPVITAVRARNILSELDR